MFENLSDKLQRAFKNLRGQGTVTEEKFMVQQFGDQYTHYRMQVKALVPYIW